MTGKERQKIEDEWIQWQRSLNKDLEQTQYRVIYLPPVDLIPYEDGPKVTKIQDEVEKLRDAWEEEDASPIGCLSLNEDWARTISMALTVYKTVLLTVHGERFRKEIRNGRKKER